jgi:glutamate mutase epsilon subunit
MIATDEIIEQYLKWDPNDETRAVVQEYVNQNNHDMLNQILTKRLAFGTAGLRAPMAPGYNAINDLVVLQTIQGIIRYLDATFGAEAKSMVSVDTSFPSFFDDFSRVL